MSDENIQSVNVLNKASYGEYEEKKSKFLCYLSPASSEEEAQQYINSIKKKHYDARHNCSAFIIGSDRALTRSSDDGEPSGTAGRPMLEVLNGANLTNVVAVVTRYFGGVLLGTGGLVRAYTEAVKDALANAELSSISYASDISIVCPYTDINKLQYHISNNNIMLIDTRYDENVTFILRCKKENEESLIASLTELTLGKVPIEVIEEGWKNVSS